MDRARLRVGLLACVRGWEGRRAVARGEPRGWLARRRWRRLAARVPAEPDPLRARLFWAAEAVFAVASRAVLLVACSPDVWHTEKPMDMAFLNAANRADDFPPADPWLAGADLNYYYLGHLAMAILVKLGGRARRGYNVAVAALFALTATAVFTLGATLWAARARAARAVRAGLGAVALVVVARQPRGRAHAARGRRPAARVRLVRPVARDRPDTITEFPWFSFLLGDLHAHVLAVPFTVLALAFALQVVLDGPRLAPRGRALAELLRGRARARDPLRDQRLVLPGDRRACSPSPWSAGCATRAARPARPGGRPLAAGRARAERAARAALPPLLRAGGARDRAGEEGRGFAGWLRDKVLVFGSLAVLVALAYLGRLAAARRPLRNGGLGRGRRRSSPARCSPRSTTRTSACSRPRSPSPWPRRLRPDAARAARASGSSSPAASPACSAPSCSTCATSSTAARCTA